MQIDFKVALEGAQAAYKIFVTSDAHAIRIYHQRFDALLFRHCQDIQNLRVNGWLTSAELHDIGVPLVLDNGVEHSLHFVDGGESTNVRVGETRWAPQVAGLGDLHKCQACVLFMVGTKPTVQWATFFNRSLEVPGKRAGFIVLALTQVIGRI